MDECMDGVSTNGTVRFSFCTRKILFFYLQGSFVAHVRSAFCESTQADDRSQLDFFYFIYDK